MNSARLPRSSRLDVQPVLPPRRLDVGQVGRVELLVEADGEVGHAQRLLHLAEELNPARQVAQRQRVRRDRIGRRRARRCAAAARPSPPASAATTSSTWTSSSVRLGIGDLDRQVVGDVVAERGDHRVVVRPAPLAEDVLEPEDRRPARRFRAANCREDLLGVPLADAVGIVELRLDRGADDHLRLRGRARGGCGRACR